MTLTDLQNLFQHKSNSLPIDLSHISREIKELLPLDIERNFQGSHDPYGVSWKKRKDNKSHPILIKTGALLSSAIQASSNANISRDKIEIDTSKLVFYGLFHQLGTKNIPARPFLGISDSLIEHVKYLIEEEIKIQMSDI